jgi:hypothetical protein
VARRSFSEGGRIGGKILWVFPVDEAQSALGNVDAQD